jgi:hypothetical protein
MTSTSKSSFARVFGKDDYNVNTISCFRIGETELGAKAVTYGTV